MRRCRGLTRSLARGGARFLPADLSVHVVGQGFWRGFGSRAGHGELLDVVRFDRNERSVVGHCFAPFDGLRRLVDFSGQELHTNQ